MVYVRGNAARGAAYRLLVFVVLGFQGRDLVDAILFFGAFGDFRGGYVCGLFIVVPVRALVFRCLVREVVVGGGYFVRLSP